MRSPCRRSRTLFPAWVAMGLAGMLLASGARGEAPVDIPPGGGAAATGPAAPPPAPARQRAVYVCQDDGIPIYADRPCGVVTLARSLVVDAPRAGGTTSLTPPEPRAATRPRRLPAVEPGQSARAAGTRCDALHRQLASLDDRMRAGYSAREAARLWQRWRDLRERLRAERC